MKKIRAIISANQEKHSHFDEYIKIIEIIEGNELVNPDICIESCKALVEGISKTILINLDNTRTPENIDRDDLPKTFRDAVIVLSDKCENLEGDFVVKFSVIIKVLGEIRNKRSDISHGRMAPKHLFSSPKLASTVVSMTESMLEYILSYYFSIELTEEGRLVFDSEEMEAYNNWLDDSIDFPIKKASYSKLLYENDYDEYEVRYNDEFLKSKEEEIEEDQLVVEMPIVGEPVPAEVEEAPKESKVEVVHHPIEPPKPVVEELVSDFDESEFWSDAKNEQLQVFSAVKNLDEEKLKAVINEFLFSEKPPLRDGVADTMKTKPALKDRGNTVKELTQKIIAFANGLKEPEQEV